MLQQERHQQILAKLELEGQVRVRELSREFQVTEDCIRKDLSALAKEGLLKRTHGGALQVRANPHTINVQERISVHSPQKKAIAQKASELIETGTTVFLGISSVNLEIAKQIYQKNLSITLVTNMIDIMQLFTRESNVRLIFLGGSFNRARDGFLGTLTIEQIERFQFDLSFLGVVGINAANGKITTYDAEDGLTKRSVLSSSKKSYMAAESAKLKQDGNYVFAHAADFSGYICEEELPKQLRKKLEEYGLEIL